jgi:siroheme synthase-like protein
MGYLPLFIDLADRPCAVIGGDELAEKRVRALLDAGAKATIIAPRLVAGIAEMVRDGWIDVRERRYIKGDLRGFALAFCTDLTEDVDAISAEARALDLPVNITDRPQLCSFLAPAVLRRGALQVAISTGGASPALAKLLRGELEEIVGPEYQLLVEILRTVRSALQQSEPDPGRRAHLARTLAIELREALTRRDNAAVSAILWRKLGLKMSDLGIDSVAEG